MHFLLTGGTLNPLKGTYHAALSKYGHTTEVWYPNILNQGVLPDTQGFDALLLPGGGDIHPSYFSMTLLDNDSEMLDVTRDNLEFQAFSRL